MSKELDTMVKLEAILEEADLSEKEMERVCDWFTSKYDPELNKCEEIILENDNCFSHNGFPNDLTQEEIDEIPEWFWNLVQDTQI